MLSFLITLQNLTSRRIERTDKGATAVEYGLMLALIAVVVIAAVTLIGTRLDAIFDKIGAALV